MNDEEQLELDIPEEPLTEEGLEKDIQRNLDKANKDYQERTFSAFRHFEKKTVRLS